MHGQEEGDACEVGECMANKRDAPRQRERGMHGRQEGCVETKGEEDAWQTRGMC